MDRQHDRKICPMNSERSVTQLLLGWRAGDEDALGKMMPIIYNALREVAARYMRAEHPNHTLQATAVVHEAYMRLVDMDVDWQDRAHFFAVAGRLMRRILVDHARAQARQKRGGDVRKVSLDEGLQVTSEPPSGLLDMDEALTRLTSFDDRKSNIVELHFFGGLTYDETAAALDISPATVDRELRLAKAWLYRELQQA